MTDWSVIVNDPCREGRAAPPCITNQWQGFPVDDEVQKKAAALAQRLHEAGRTEHASRLVAAARDLERGAESALSATLLAIADAVLNTAEIVDPRTQAMAEELRTMVEAKLARPRSA